jgi:hypothetical protein
MRNKKMNYMVETLYSHMLTTQLKLINFHGTRYVLSCLKDNTPGVTPLGIEGYDELLEKYGIFV